MSKRLYVGNLPYTTTEDAIKSHFAVCGVVENVSLVTDRETGRARGFGFVDMDSEENAKKAIADLNGSQLGGRNLVVNEARERETRGGSSNGGYRGNRNNGGYRQ